MEIPTYKITFDPANFESGMDLLAVTENPAIEELSLRFEKYSKIVFATNEDQQLIVGPAMIPDKPIYRNENGKEFYVVFTKEVIEGMLEKFQSEQRTIKFNIEHDSNQLVEGFVKEAWIVEDSEKDKSALYGFNLPVGTLMISAKITNKEIWENTIKKMNQVGFSVEGLMGIQKFMKESEESSSEELNQNKQTKMSKEKTRKLKFFAKKISTKKKFNVSTKKFEEVIVSEEEEVLIVEDLAEGAAVEMLDDNGEVVAAEDGTFEIPSEEVIVEVEDGEIVAIEEAPAEEETEMKAEKDEEKEKMEVDPETLAKIVELESRLEALEAKLAEGEAEEAFEKKTKFSKDASKAQRLSTLRKLVK
jgi:hypothetical protein